MSRYFIGLSVAFILGGVTTAALSDQPIVMEITPGSIIVRVNAPEVIPPSPLTPLPYKGDEDWQRIWIA